MPATRQELFDSAMKLSEQERLLLATELLNTVADDLPIGTLDDPEFQAELELRANDGSPGIPWTLVEAQLRADLQQ